MFGTLKLSHVPAVFAALAAVALLYADAIAPLVLSPQTGWHLAGSVRWIWLAFGAAGAAKGLLLTTAVLRAVSKSSKPAAIVQPTAQATNQGNSAKKIVASKSGVEQSKTTPEAERPAVIVQRTSLTPWQVQSAVLKALATLSFVVASTATLAPRGLRLVSKALKYGRDYEDSLVSRWLPVRDGGPRVAAVMATLIIGPLFWALGCLFAIALTHTLLAGRPSQARRAVLLFAVSGIISAAAMSYVASHPQMLPPGLQDILYGFQSLRVSLPLPPRPATSVLTALAAVFAVAAHTAPLWQTAAASGMPLKDLAAERVARSTRGTALAGGRSGVWGILRLTMVAWLALVVSELARLNITAFGRDAPFETSDGSFKVLWRGESALGERLSVVEGEHPSAKFRVLRAGHSILGGIYIEPEWSANQSIYDIFHIHEGIRLATAGNHSLHIGLGIGVASKTLVEFGETADIIELHPEIVHLAKTYFAWHGNGSVLESDAEDGILELLADEKPPLYDHIIHDVFSGGAVPRRLLASPLLKNLHKILVRGGVLAVNFYGDPNGVPARKFAADLHQEFGHVRCLTEASRQETRNLVFFAAEVPILFRLPIQEDELQDGSRKNSLQTYFQPRDSETYDNGTTLNAREHDLGWLTGTTAEERDSLARQAAGPAGLAADVAAAEHHWTVMRYVFSNVFWSEAY